jgi:xanthine dehydrogenase molybdopterin-binding subunit B
MNGGAPSESRTRSLLAHARAPQRTQQTTLTPHRAAGATPDLSFFCCLSFAGSLDQVYYSPHFSVDCAVLRTNTPSRTAMRGPGEIQASFAMETIIEHVAAEAGLPPHVVREANLYSPAVDQPERMMQPSGTPITHWTMPRLWHELKAAAGFDALAAEVDAFNGAHRHVKRGLSITPVKYASSEIRARNLLMHPHPPPSTPGLRIRRLTARSRCRYGVQAITTGAAVSVFAHDGTVVVSHGGCEIGQGIHTKVCQVAAMQLGTPARFELAVS